MQVIDELRKMGVKVWADGKDICYEQEVEGINENRVDNLLAKIKIHKEEAIQYLQLDTELTTMYETTLENIAAKYEAGGLNWLSAQNPALYAAIEKAEDGLNEVWDQCLEYKASIDNFKRSLHKWYGLQIEGVEYHRSSIN